MSRNAKPLGAQYRKLFAASTISNLGDGIGTLAYPWLASAVTRNPLLIALVVVAQRLPWLLFTLPAGVITDRAERRSLMVKANVARATLTAFIAVAVATRRGSLPGPDVVADANIAIPTDTTLYLVIVAATLLLGMAEVLYDNTAQTIMPSLVDHDRLEKANGRLWSAELVSNNFAGPPVAALLLAVAFALPFLVDAITFAVSAALVSLLPRPEPGERAKTKRDRPHWKAEIREGFQWLWSHDLLRPMAIILGILNALGMVAGSILVLYGQEVLDTSPAEFAILSMGGAVGGVVGGWTASGIAKRIGSGPSLSITLLGGAAIHVAIGLSSDWPIVFVLMAVFMLTAVLWNVITVSLRQSIIPDHLLGRVNSVYRFFAWGMMPVGALVGGLIVFGFEEFTSREYALRAAWLIAAVGHLLLWTFAAPRLTTAKIEAARAAVDTPERESAEPRTD